MKWFKFYGQDFITDSKMGYLNTAQRLLWIYLLSMASQSDKKDGVLKFITLNHLRQLAGITENDENWKLTENTFELFEKMGLVTISNEIVTICNYKKYQEQALTGAERQAKFRESKNTAQLNVTESNEIVTKMSSQSNARIDKNRIDKNIKETNTNVLVKKKSAIDNLIQKDFEDIAYDYQTTIPHVLSCLDDLKNYCDRTGKTYKDYKAALRNFVKKDAFERRGHVQSISKISFVGDSL